MGNREGRELKDASVVVPVDPCPGNSGLVCAHKNEYTSYIIVDFANAPQGVWDAVKNIADLDNFFFQLQFIYKVKLLERKSVVIFDEIQNAPLVRQAIKYMVKDHRYDYIETGSLLSIKKNTNIYSL